MANVIHDISSEEVQRKFNSLRGYYTQILKKDRDTSKNGIGGSIDNGGVWWFNRINFLREFVNLRPPENSIDIKEESSYSVIKKLVVSKFQS